MTACELAARDVAGIHPWQGVVHEQVYVEVVDPGGLADRSVGLTKVVTPFRQDGSLLLMLNQVTSNAVGRKQPDVGLDGMHLSANSDGSDQTTDHFARKRDVKRSIFPAFWLGNVKESFAKIEMLKAHAFNRIRPTS